VADTAAVVVTAGCVLGRTRVVGGLRRSGAPCRIVWDVRLLPDRSRAPREIRSGAHGTHDGGSNRVSEATHKGCVRAVLATGHGVHRDHPEGHYDRQQAPSQPTLLLLSRQRRTTADAAPGGPVTAHRNGHLLVRRACVSLLHLVRGHTTAGRSTNTLLHLYPQWVCWAIRSIPLRDRHREGRPLANVMPGYITEKQAYLNRLRRIEGQVRGLQRMVDQDAYCIDILTQVSAATKALQNVALSLLDEHLKHCVTDAVRAGGDGADAKLTEASAAIGRLVRS